MSLHDSDGNRIYEKIYCKVIIPMNTVRRKFPFTVVADKGKGYGEKQIDVQLERIAAHVEKSFPRFEFKMVQLTVNRFNFIAVGVKKEK